MATFIKTGFWEQTERGPKGWLNLNEFIVRLTRQSRIIIFKDVDETAYTLSLTDDYITCSEACVITVPHNDDIAFPVGTVITIEQGGVGEVSVAGDTDVIVNSYEGSVLPGQYACVQLTKKSTNTWTLIGGTS